MRIIDTTTAEHYRWGEQSDGWHLVASEGLSVIQERVPAGGTEVLHLHRHAHQFFYVLKGTATLEVDGTVYELKPCQGMEIPPGTPHQLKNLSTEEITFLVISSPPSHGDRELLE